MARSSEKVADITMSGCTVRLSEKMTLEFKVVSRQVRKGCYAVIRACWVDAACLLFTKKVACFATADNHNSAYIRNEFLYCVWIVCVVRITFNKSWLSKHIKSVRFND